jgi:hypothetical protein
MGSGVNHRRPSFACPRRSRCLLLAVASLLTAGAAAAAPAERLSCRADAGAKRAAELVRKCLTSSAATHPPCNDANPCSLIIDSIRSTCREGDDCGDDGAPLATRARDALHAWQAAQLQGNEKDYFALYDAARFVGIKRTAGGAIQRYDFAAWMADRRKMLAGPNGGPTVVADAVVFKDIEHPPGDSALGPEQPVQAEFVQRWKSRRYADHGRKIIRWGWRQGALRIVYEEMVSSAAGWDDSPPWLRIWFTAWDMPLQTLDGTDLKPPITVRVIGEPITIDDPPSGLIRIVLRDAAGVERAIGLGPLLRVDAGPYPVDDNTALLFDGSFWWAGGGQHLVVRHRGDVLVITMDYEVESEASATAAARATEMVRIRLARGARVRGSKR